METDIEINTEERHCTNPNGDDKHDIVDPRARKLCAKCYEHTVVTKKHWNIDHVGRTRSCHLTDRLKRVICMPLLVANVVHYPPDGDLVTMYYMPLLLYTAYL